MNRKTACIFVICLLCFTAFTGCASNTSRLDPQKPVALTMWHVFGGQTHSPMNDMVEEFNSTVGKEYGVHVSVTSVSTSSDIHDALMAAANGDPGAGSLPDLFFCYPETAGAIGADRLIAWDELFGAEELAEYVPAFLEEGVVDDKLLVFPVAKSSEALFVNTTIFDRFSKDCGVAYEDLATWESLFLVSEKYYDWSGGKNFLMHDEPLNFVQFNTMALGGEAYLGNALNFDDPVFRQQWEAFAKAAVSRHVRVEDNYETVCMMTGDIVAGIGSTASIMYFQDTVTYRDNTTEPLVIKALPCPVTQNGTKPVIQQGAGLAAIGGDEQKEQAALLFCRWLTGGETNLRFVTQSGYMPVKNDAFEAIGDFAFESESWHSLYEAMNVMRGEYQFCLPPVVDGYYGILWTFYENSIEILNDCRSRYEAGDSSLDDLVDESYARMRKVMGYIVNPNAPVRVEKHEWVKPNQDIFWACC